jgi:hypothetical protein
MIRSSPSFGRREKKLSYVLRALATSAILLALGRGAVAEGLDYCHDYATAAVIKADENLAFRCRYSGPRWITNYVVHFVWCLGAPRPITIRERTLRRRMISACHG